MLKKIFAFLILVALLLPQLAFGQATLLPEQSEYFSTYEGQYNGLSVDQKKIYRSACDYYLKNILGERTLLDKVKTALPEIRQDILSCAIKSGRVHLWMLPYFITSIVNFLIYISGTVAVLFVLLGGFWYMTGGLTDDKEKGKKTITYALMGLVITLLAWIIVNIIMVQVTG